MNALAVTEAVSMITSVRPMVIAAPASIQTAMLGSVGQSAAIAAIRTPTNLKTWPARSAVLTHVVFARMKTSGPRAFVGVLKTSRPPLLPGEQARRKGDLRRA